MQKLSLPSKDCRPARLETCSEVEEIVKPPVSMQDPASRKIVQRTRGLSRGPIVRLISPSDLGDVLPAISQRSLLRVHALRKRIPQRHRGASES
jgi:hypothetical protein